MKNIYPLRHVFVMMTMLFFACDQKNENHTKETPRIRKETKIESPKINQEFKLHDEVEFIISSKAVIDSIVIEVGTEQVVFKEKTFSIELLTRQTGTQKARVIVYFEGTSENHYPRIKVLSNEPPAAYSYKIIKKYPHSTDAYTQGLFIKEDTLYESTGQHNSTFGKINMDTGEPYQFVTIGSEYFGEGSTYWNDLLIMVTWTKKTGFVFDSNFNQIRTFNYLSQGWGLTTHQDLLIMSDGTEVLHFLDPRDFSEVKKLEVYDHNGPVQSINELEMIEGILYANIYPENYILMIDPQAGNVIGKIDLQSIKPTDLRGNTDKALNGIAYNPKSQKIYVTGKLWPTLFEVQFIKQNVP